jgi:hypothetical protein
MRSPTARAMRFASMSDLPRQARPRGRAHTEALIRERPVARDRFLEPRGTRRRRQRDADDRRAATHGMRVRELVGCQVLAALQNRNSEIASDFSTPSQPFTSHTPADDGGPYRPTRTSIRTLAVPIASRHVGDANPLVALLTASEINLRARRAAGAARGATSDGRGRIAMPCVLARGLRRSSRRAQLAVTGRYRHLPQHDRRRYRRPCKTPKSRAPDGLTCYCPRLRIPSPAP